MGIFAKIAIAGAIASSAFVAGCASTSSGSVYSGGQARQEQTVRMGVVESVRQVTIEGSKSGVGAMAGPTSPAAATLLRCEWPIAPG